MKKVIGWVLIGLSILSVTGALMGNRGMYSLMAAAIWAAIGYLSWYFLLRSKEDNSE